MKHNSLIEMYSNHLILQAKGFVLIWAFTKSITPQYMLIIKVKPLHIEKQVINII